MDSEEQIKQWAGSFVAHLDSLLQRSSGNDQSASTIAAELDSAWAIPLLVLAWDGTLSGYGGPQIRPAIKEAIHALKKTMETGSSRSEQKVSDLIVACAMKIEERASLLEGRAGVEGSDELVAMLRVTGAKLHTSPDVNTLLSGGLGRALGIISGVLSERIHPPDLADELPLLSRLPMTPATREIWHGIYLRLLLPILLEDVDSDSASNLKISRYPFNWASIIQATGQMTPAVINNDDIQRSLSLDSPPPDNVADSHLTAYPIHRIQERFVTSIALILDSIAPWLQIQIENHQLGEKMISKPFEDQVIATMRRKGFIAGEVTDGGVWEHGCDHPSESISQISKALRAAAKAQQVGQIDVLAVRTDGIFLIECKTMAGTGSVYSMSRRSITGDAKKWHLKARKKKAWLEEALGRPVDLSLIVVSGLDLLRTSSESDGALIVSPEILEEIPEHRA
ncbi:hypothetical protein ACTI_73690 [Actinoplanes sp. OR16]|uniref:nuclease-related domain-containing protein n=1 Tax=Actinoplanes sp. OR16 TaxID=946334 RepID=UPI000F7177F9|nr:nuclease-related domain-containing protein [Actinoplanes sp. OR16]BBH70684.1 hypothetical protein ACTI_73690 [Actinoplanes sp. OR16]